MSERIGLMDGLETPASQRDPAAEFGEQIQLAARLQQGFLPRRLPEVGLARFGVLFRPAGWLSGDFYDITRLDETHVGFYVVDAVGHGLPAALLTMFIKRALKTKRIAGNTYQIVPPHIALAELNADICDQDLASCSFCTAVYCTLDVANHTLTYARAGHPAPILIRSGRQIETLEVSGGLLGVFPDAEFTSHTCQLEPGDRLILHTDGVDHVFSLADDTPPTASAFLERLQAWSSFSRPELLLELAGLTNAVGEIEPHMDDVTVLVMDLEHPSAAGPWAA